MPNLLDVYKLKLISSYGRERLLYKQEKGEVKVLSLVANLGITIIDIRHADYS